MAGRGYDNQSNGTEMLLAIGAAVAVLWILIIFKPEIFVIPWQGQKIAETAVLRYIPMPGKQHSDVNYIFEYLTTTPPSQVTAKNFSRIQASIWKITRVPYAFIISILGVLILRRKKFKNKHTQESLINQESKNWPWIERFKTIHPEKKSLTDKEYGFRKKIAEFSKEKGILKNMEFNKALAAAVFSEQLGKKFTAFEDLDPGIKRIVAICFLRLHRKDKESGVLIDEVSHASATRKWSTVDKKVNKIISTMQENDQINACKKSHAYAITVTIALLEEARKGGVIPPNWFSWMKPTDRTMWYALSDTGLSVATIEAAGIRSHYLLEKEIGRAVPKPYVEQACVALKKFLNTAGMLSNS